MATDNFKQHAVQVLEVLDNTSEGYALAVLFYCAATICKATIKATPAKSVALKSALSQWWETLTNDIQEYETDLIVDGKITEADFSKAGRLMEDETQKTSKNSTDDAS